MMSRRTKVLLGGLGIFVVLFAAIQLVPYRITNPSTDHEPAWNSPETRRLAVAACFNCHSNETSTFWFEDIAPLSWWITNHVDEGRSKLNFSECTQGSGEHDDDAAREVRDGSMPPNYYTWLGLHGEAKLSQAQREKLAAGLEATLAGWSCGRERNDD
jgi:hypothetical protein